MHGAAASAARRVAELCLLEARMRSAVAWAMAKRQAELDELAAHGLTPFTWGLERGFGSPPTVRNE
jgi:hypothetical protein